MFNRLAGKAPWMPNVLKQHFSDLRVNEPKLTDFISLEIHIHLKLRRNIHRVNMFVI